jgi:hypothetical protein
MTPAGACGGCDRGTRRLQRARKLSALCDEFAEIGVNAAPADLCHTYPTFFWNVNRSIQTVSAPCA